MSLCEFYFCRFFAASGNELAQHSQDTFHFGTPVMPHELALTSDEAADATYSQVCVCVCVCVCLRVVCGGLGSAEACFSSAGVVVLLV